MDEEIEYAYPSFQRRWVEKRDVNYMYFTREKEELIEVICPSNGHAFLDFQQWQQS
jgi:hypothetical protein